MQLVLFGEKRKHVKVPEGFVLIDNQQRQHKEVAVLAEHKDGEELYSADKYLNMQTGVFQSVDASDFVDEDGNKIDNFVENYSILARDVRALSYHPVPTLPEKGVIVMDPNTDLEWRLILS